MSFLWVKLIEFLRFLFIKSPTAVLNSPEKSRLRTLPFAQKPKQETNNEATDIGAETAEMIGERYGDNNFRLNYRLNLSDSAPHHEGVNEHVSC